MRCSMTIKDEEENRQNEFSRKEKNFKRLKFSTRDLFFKSNRRFTTNHHLSTTLDTLQKHREVWAKINQIHWKFHENWVDFSKDFCRRRFFLLNLMLYERSKWRCVKFWEIKKEALNFRLPYLKASSYS